MIEVTFRVENIDYSDRFDSQLPLVFEAMKENGDLNPVMKLACTSPESTAKVIKGVLKTMTKGQKERLAVRICNSQRARLMRKVNSLAERYGIVGTVTDCTAVVKK